MHPFQRRAREELDVAALEGSVHVTIESAGRRYSEVLQPAVIGSRHNQRAAGPQRLEASRQRAGRGEKMLDDFARDDAANGPPRLS